MLAILLANGFEEIEALGTVDILRRCEEEVMIVSTENGTNKVTGGHDITIECDTNLHETFDSIKTAQVVILPGGMQGVSNLSKCEKVKELLDNQVKEKGFIAAICAAPTLFGKYGYLKNKTAVCYPGMEKELLGALHGVETAVISGNIITGKAAGTTADFAMEIMKAIGKADVCKTVLQSMYFDCPSI